jgi:hypothetical protein
MGQKNTVEAGKQIYITKNVIELTRRGRSYRCTLNKSIMKEWARKIQSKLESKFILLNNQFKHHLRLKYLEPSSKQINYKGMDQ